MRALFIVLFGISALSISAQKANVKPLRLGFQVGYGPTMVLKFESQGEGDYQGGSNVQVGLLAQKQLTDHFSLVLNPLYQNYRYEFRFVFDPWSGEPNPFLLEYPYSLNAQSISIPILARWDFGTKTTFFVQTGLQFDFEFSRVHRRDLRWTKDILPPENIYLGKIHEFDEVRGVFIPEFSGVIGLGCSIPVSSSFRLLLEGRGTLKLTATELYYSYSSDEVYFAHALNMLFIIGGTFDLGN